MKLSLWFYCTASQITALGFSVCSPRLRFLPESFRDTASAAPVGKRMCSGCFLWFYCTASPIAAFGFFLLLSSPAVPAGIVSGYSVRGPGGKANVLGLFSVVLLYCFPNRGFGVFLDGILRFRQRIKERSIREFPERFFGSIAFPSGRCSGRVSLQNRKGCIKPTAMV